MIDSQAPIPQALEGGDGNGPLYLCILRQDKVDALKSFCQQNPGFHIYGTLHPMLLEDSLYRPDAYVRWQFGKDPTVSLTKYPM